MTIQIVDRKDLPEDYIEMMETEQHHQHVIVRDDNGVLRWKEDPFINRLVDACNLNNIIAGFNVMGINKNQEVYRELYRRLGYSLCGYWEIFYWDVNNPIANQYVPPLSDTH